MKPFVNTQLLWVQCLFQAQSIAHTHLDFILTSSQVPWIKECSWQGLSSVTGNNRKHGSKQKAGANVLLTESRFGRQQQGTFRNSAEQVPPHSKSPTREALNTERRGPTWSVSLLCVFWGKVITCFMKATPTQVTSSCFSIKCYCLTEEASRYWLHKFILTSKNKFNEILNC